MGHRGRQERHEASGLHERLDRPGHEAVGEEEVLLDAECRIETLEIACAVSGDAVAEYQILRPRGRANRVGLHIPQASERAFECCRRKKASADGKAPEVVEGDRAGNHARSGRRHRVFAIIIRPASHTLISGPP